MGLRAHAHLRVFQYDRTFSVVLEENTGNNSLVHNSGRDSFTKRGFAMSKNSKKDLNPKKESWLEHMKRMGYTKEQAYGLDLCQNLSLLSVRTLKNQMTSMATKKKPLPTKLFG